MPRRSQCRDIISPPGPGSASGLDLPGTPPSGSGAFKVWLGMTWTWSDLTLRSSEETHMHVCSLTDRKVVPGVLVPLLMSSMMISVCVCVCACVCVCVCACVCVQNGFGGGGEGWGISQGCGHAQVSHRCSCCHKRCIFQEYHHGAEGHVPPYSSDKLFWCLIVSSRECGLELRIEVRPVGCVERHVCKRKFKCFNRTGPAHFFQRPREIDASCVCCVVFKPSSCDVRKFKKEINFKLNAGCAWCAKC